MGKVRIISIKALIEAKSGIKRIGAHIGRGFIPIVFKMLSKG